MRSRKHKALCQSTETLEIRDVKAAAITAALTNHSNPQLSDVPATAETDRLGSTGWSRPWQSMTPIDLKPAAGVMLELGDGRRFEFDSPTAGTLVHPDGTRETYVNLDFEVGRSASHGNTTLDIKSSDWWYTGEGDGIGNYLQRISDEGAYSYVRFGGTRLIDQAKSLDLEHQFSPTEKDFENWGGRGEKWFTDGNGHWHFITPDGAVFRWTVSGKAEGTLVAKVDASFHQSPEKLTTAADPGMMPADGVVLNLGQGNRFEFTGPKTGRLVHANGSVTLYVNVVSPPENSGALFFTHGTPLVAQVHNAIRPIYGVAVYESAMALDAKHGFELQDKLFENWGGKEEKWFKDSGDLWHFITPEGSIFRQTVSGKAEGHWIGSVAPTFYSRPELLTISSDSNEASSLDDVFSELDPGFSSH